MHSFAQYVPNYQFVSGVNGPLSGHNLMFRMRDNGINHVINGGDTCVTCARVATSRDSSMATTCASRRNWSALFVNEHAENEGTLETSHWPITAYLS